MNEEKNNNPYCFGFPYLRIATKLLQLQNSKWNPEKRRTKNQVAFTISKFNKNPLLKWWNNKRGEGKIETLPKTWSETKEVKWVCG